MLRVVTDKDRRCEDCGEALPRIASAIFRANEGCCPRCAFLHRDVGIEFGQVEIRNMAVKGRSSIRVPRVEFHQPGRQPATAIPVGG